MMTPLRIVSLKPLIVVGDGAAIADVMVTPERAKYALLHARLGLADAWRKLDAVCEDPPEWMVEGYPEFWTHEARLERWLARCRSVARWIAAVHRWEAKVAQFEGVCARERCGA